MKTRYDFEIKNDLGSVQGSMILVVEEDTQHSKAADVVEKTDGFESNHIGKEKFGECDIVATDILDVVKKINSPESNPITVEEYKEYVAGLHSLNNKAFETQYKVYTHPARSVCDAFMDQRHNIRFYAMNESNILQGPVNSFHAGIAIWRGGKASEHWEIW